MLSEVEKKRVSGRLKRIEGQVSGIHRMVGRDAYCVDILNQISAVHAALSQVGKLVLGQHVRTCVQDSFRSGDEGDRHEKIEELLEIVTKLAGIGKA